MNIHQRFLLFFAALYGAVSVIMAALGTHAFYALLVANHQVETFDKAVDYAMYGALVLLAVVALSRLFSSKVMLISGYLFAVGTFLFSLSLFLYTLAGLNALTALTPIGGTTLIIAWLLLGAAVFRRAD